MKKLPRKWSFLIGLTVILASEFLLRDVFLPKNPSAGQVAIAILTEWLVFVFLLAFWIPRVEGNDLRSIGIGKRKWRYLRLGILAYFVLFIISIGSEFIRTAGGLAELSSLQPLLRQYSFPLLLSLCFTGTILEEVFYRGYLIERVTSLTGKTWLAGIVSWITFTSVHFKFFGLGPTLKAGVFAAGLVLVYLRERSVWPCMVIHGLNDAFAYLIAPLLL
jgi:membrane protease YdiL (CAAX protease family)